MECFYTRFPLLTPLYAKYNVKVYNSLTKCDVAGYEKYLSIMIKLGYQACAFNFVCVFSETCKSSKEAFKLDQVSLYVIRFKVTFYFEGEPSPS